MLALTLVFGVVCAEATFIENDYGTPTAWASVYNSKWFELIQLFLALNLLLNIKRFKLYRKEKLPALVFHVGFLFIIIGAGVTRYIGYEGVLHIRDTQTKNTISTPNSYIQIQAKKGDKLYYYDKKFVASKLSKNDFKITFLIDGKKDTLTSKNFIPNATIKLKNGKRVVVSQKVEGGKNTQSNFKSAIIATLEYNGEKKDITMFGYGDNRKGDMVKAQIKDTKFLFEWGSKELPLPFSVKLKKFELKRYPGSMSPSSYASYVTVTDGSKKFDFKIYMNHVLDYKGYRLFQSSYDMDEKGSILSVNHDPGKTPTYFGYILLAIGMILNFLNPKSRFRKLASRVQKETVVSAFALLLITHTQVLKADNLDEAKLYDFQHSELFGDLLLQKQDGRIVTMDSFS